MAPSISELSFMGGVRAAWFYQSGCTAGHVLLLLPCVYLLLPPLPKAFRISWQHSVALFDWPAPVSLIGRWLLSGNQFIRGAPRGSLRCWCLVCCALQHHQPCRLISAHLVHVLRSVLSQILPGVLVWEWLMYSVVNNVFKKCSHNYRYLEISDDKC